MYFCVQRLKRGRVAVGEVRAWWLRYLQVIESGKNDVFKILTRKDRNRKV